jgi:serine/threonine protein phosphatase 1
MSLIYAIGDVHGQDGLLARLHARIALDPGRPADAPTPTVIHLGDYIDRGPESADVIDRIMRGTPAFDTVALMGNHEAMLLDCLDSDDRDVWMVWLANGGDRTLEALGYRLRVQGYDPRALAEAVGRRRIDWLRSLPIQHRAGRYLFVHAGIVPGVPLEAQHPKDLLWIRRRFLDSDADHGVVVVHGHTPTEAPELRHNRIGIDTGAAWPRTLTAVALDGDAPPRLLQVSEDR